MENSQPKCDHSEEDKLLCTRFHLFLNILTKNKGNSPYTPIPDRPGLYTLQKAEEQMWATVFLDHCDNKWLFSHYHLSCLVKVQLSLTTLPAPLSALLEQDARTQRSDLTRTY